MPFSSANVESFKYEQRQKYWGRNVRRDTQQSRKTSDNNLEFLRYCETTIKANSILDSITSNYSFKGKDFYICASPRRF